MTVEAELRNVAVYAAVDAFEAEQRRWRLREVGWVAGITMWVAENDLSLDADPASVANDIQRYTFEGPNAKQTAHLWRLEKCMRAALKAAAKAT